MLEAIPQRNSNFAWCGMLAAFSRGRLKVALVRQAGSELNNQLRAGSHGHLKSWACLYSCSMADKGAGSEGAGTAPPESDTPELKSAKKLKKEAKKNAKLAKYNDKMAKQAQPTPEVLSSHPPPFTPIH